MPPATHPTAWTFKPFQSARSYIPGYGNKSKIDNCSRKWVSWNKTPIIQLQLSRVSVQKQLVSNEFVFSKSSKLSTEENEIKVEGEKLLQEVLSN